MSVASTSLRFQVDALRETAYRLLTAAGLGADKADAVADILIEGDLLGHSTHGLNLLSAYLEEIVAGSMTPDGEPEVISDVGATLTWDGRRLPGPWIMLKALDVASTRARTLGVGIVCVRRSHHIAALAPYARRVALAGQVLQLMTSAPSGVSVAPYGGTQPLFSPSPIGVGIPTSGDPILVDVSTSITTNNLTSLLASEGRRLPGHWLLDEEGRPTDDPQVLVKPRQGSIQPIGGVDNGHKGYGLSLMVEAMTSGLAGHGKADPAQRLGASLFIQVLDPRAFAGMEGMHRQMDWLAQACHTNRPIDPQRPVRLPGERGLALWKEQMREGMSLNDGITRKLSLWADKLGVPMPSPLQN